MRGLGTALAIPNATPMRNSSHESSLRALIGDGRGAVTTEYVVLVGMIGLAVVFALVTVGPKLVNDFGRARDITSSPIP